MTDLKKPASKSFPHDEMRELRTPSSESLDEFGSVLASLEIDAVDSKINDSLGESSSTSRESAEPTGTPQEDAPKSLILDETILVGDEDGFERIGQPFLVDNRLHLPPDLVPEQE